MSKQAWRQLWAATFNAFVVGCSRTPLGGGAQTVARNKRKIGAPEQWGSACLPSNIPTWVIFKRGRWMDKTSVGKCWHWLVKPQGFSVHLSHPWPQHSFIPSAPLACIVCASCGPYFLSSSQGFSLRLCFLSSSYLLEQKASKIDAMSMILHPHSPLLFLSRLAFPFLVRFLLIHNFRGAILIVCLPMCICIDAFHWIDFYAVQWRFCCQHPCLLLWPHGQQNLQHCFLPFLSHSHPGELSAFSLFPPLYMVIGVFWWSFNFFCSDSAAVPILRKFSCQIQPLSIVDVLLPINVWKHMSSQLSLLFSVSLVVLSDSLSTLFMHHSLVEKHICWYLLSHILVSPSRVCFL